MENNKHKQNDEFISINDFWHLCLSHWNWYVASVLICIGYAFYYLSTTQEMYTCEAAILVREDTQGKTVAKNAAGENFDEMSLVRQSVNVTNVQRELTSLRVLTEVAKMKFPNADDAKVLRWAERIRRRLKAKIDDEKSTVINLKYVDTSPEEAKKVLTNVIKVYNEKWLEDKNQIAISASQFIEDRLSLIERELGIVDDSISSFKIRNKITSIEQVGDVYLQQVSSSDAEILRLNNQKTMAQYILDILRDKSAHRQLLPTNSGINNAVAETQITQYNNMLMQLKNNLHGTSKQNPLIRKQESDIEDMKKNILATIANQIKTLDIQITALEGYNEEAKEKVKSNPEQAKHLVSVEREQKVKENLYLYLLQKKEENQISMTYTSQNTQVLDMPHGNEHPTSPDKKSVLFGAAIMALLFPTAILFLRESLNNTVRDKYDIERKISLPLVGEIPNWKKKSKESMIVVEQDKQDLVNEAFRLIRTNLEFMTGKTSDKNVYIVTSSYEGSGKTFVSMNLAIVLAIKHKRVLFIDGDLRHASASYHFDCPDLGIADYLAEKENDLSRLIVKHDKYPSLDILPVGTIPPNPTELLSDSRLEELLTEVRSRYDFVLIDCPPAESLADTGIIERHTDRTLFIIRAGLFMRKRIYDLESDAQNGKYKHISIILNGTKNGGQYGYRYGYKYGHYYSKHYHNNKHK